MSLIGYVLTPQDVSTSNLELGPMLHCSDTFILSTDSNQEQGKISFPIVRMHSDRHGIGTGILTIVGLQL